MSRRNRYALWFVLCFSVFFIGAWGAVGWFLLRAATTDIVVHVRRDSPDCELWVKALRAAGLHVEIRIESDLAAIRHAANVPEQLAACHTAIAKQGHRYVFEGHVDVGTIKWLMRSNLAVRGLAGPAHDQSGRGSVAGKGGQDQIWVFDDAGRISKLDELRKVLPDAGR